MIAERKIPLIVNFIIISAVILLILVMGIEHNKDSQYTIEYYFLLGSFAFISFLYIIALNKMSFDIFHPIHIYILFHFCIFYITPLVLINAGHTLCCGVDVMQGCVNATFIETLGLVFYLLGYYKSKIKLQNNTDIDFSKIERQKLMKFSYILFFIFTSITFYYALGNGKSLFYIFSLGGGQYELTSNEVEAKFMINFAYSAIVPWLIICYFSNKKIIHIILSYILLALFLSFGWRFIFYIMAIAYSIIYFKKKNKKANIIYIAVMGIFLLLFSVWLGSVRGQIRSGQSTEFEGFSNENLAFTLESNFNIYQPFYGIVSKYPNQYDHTFGQAIFVYPVIMWVPRAIWPEKPLGNDYPINVAVKNSINNFAIDTAGMAVPNIGEYYLDFGIFGVLFMSYIIGIMCKRSVSLYNSSDSASIIKYAIFCGYLIQFINRGYIAQLITLAFFFYMPFVMYKIVFKRQLCKSR